MDCAEKTRWTSERKARRAARVVTSEQGCQMRAYACPECRGWHLSSLISEPVPRATRRHFSKRGRRPAPGQSLEDLAREIREGATSRRAG